MKAIWNDEIIADSNKTLKIEGNAYFPPESINRAFFKETETQTVCHWKGTASYYDIEVNGTINKDAAWSYPNPSGLADKIKDYVAFWKGVKIIED